MVTNLRACITTHSCTDTEAHDLFVRPIFVALICWTSWLSPKLRM